MNSRMFRNTAAAVVMWCLACAVPATPPEQIASTVSNFWRGTNFPALASYITNLAATEPTNPAALLALAFHDAVFRGDLSGAEQKVAQSKALVSLQPLLYAPRASEAIEEYEDVLRLERQMHERQGTLPSTLASNASPEAVRSAWGDVLPEPIEVLFSILP